MSYQISQEDDSDALRPPFILNPKMGGSANISSRSKVKSCQGRRRRSMLWRLILLAILAIIQQSCSLFLREATVGISAFTSGLKTEPKAPDELLTNILALRGGAASQDSNSDSSSSNWPYHVAYESIFIETKDKVAHLLHDQESNSTRCRVPAPVVQEDSSHANETATKPAANVSSSMSNVPVPPVKKSKIVLPTPSPPGTSTTYATLKKNGYLKHSVHTNVEEGSSVSSSNMDTVAEKEKKPLFLRMLERRMGPFVFKGFGFSIAKPFFPMYSLGAGLRIPITSNFPVYDKRIENPRISSQLSCYSNSEETYLRASMSFSLPLQVLLYMIAVACTTYLKLYAHDSKGGISISLNKIKNIRASDSVKRCGFSVSIRCGTKNGLRWNVSPWLFYMPSHAVLQKILPLFYACPALGLAIASILCDIFPSFSEQSKHLADIPASSTNTASQPGVTPASTASTIMTPPVPVPVLHSDTFSDYCYRTFRHCRKKVLSWASRHTSALGWNVGCSKTQGKNVSPSISIAFECQPFFPKWSKISQGWLLLQYIDRLWSIGQHSLYRLLNVNPASGAFLGRDMPIVKKGSGGVPMIGSYTVQVDGDESMKVKKTKKKKRSRSAHL